MRLMKTNEKGLPPRRPASLNGREKGGEERLSKLLLKLLIARARAAETRSHLDDKQINTAGLCPRTIS